MKSASFLFLSLTLHIGALLYPVSFRDRLEEQFFPVTILAVERGPGKEANPGGGERLASPVRLKPAALAPRLGKRALEFNPAPSQPQRQPIAAEPVETTSATSAAVANISQSSERESATIEGSTNPAGSIGADLAGIGGQAYSPGHFGSGSGHEDGQGNSPGAVITPARYSETPAPLYPESARRDGREGRVLLRVLVDDQGLPKTVEVNKSSGEEVLDRAAAEAIKRWRFHPARYGDKAIESWIRIPIEFRLASANR
jgi:protein TonB